MAPHRRARAPAWTGVLFRPLRRRGTQIVLVIASFGASLALRYGLAFLYGPEPAYYTREIQLAMPIVPGLPAVRAPPTSSSSSGSPPCWWWGSTSSSPARPLGRAMRAVSENPALARVVGVDPAGGRALDVAHRRRARRRGRRFVGLTVQVRPLARLRPAPAALRGHDPGGHGQRLRRRPRRAPPRAGRGARRPPRRRGVPRGRRLRASSWSSSWSARAACSGRASDDRAGRAR